jgi:hypothetical protein
LPTHGGTQQAVGRFAVFCVAMISHPPRRRRAAIAGSVVIVGALVTVVVIAARSTTSHSADSTSPLGSTATTTSPRPTPTTSTPTPTPKPKPAPTLASPAGVTSALRRLAARLPAGGVSVAALNMKTGARFSFGASGGMRTGSVAKLFLLEAVLLQHQDAGTPVSENELELATPMIENSDNKAEYSLYLDAGGRDALVSAFPRLGLKHSIPGYSDPALTTTNATDGITLVRNLVRGGPLNAYSRSFALGLMRNVESDQRWGVSAVADPGSSVALKNGWLSVDNDNSPGENDDGLWLVNSVGVVTVHGQQVLLSAFTQHGPDYASGIHLVESLVRAITPAVVAESG